MIGYYVHHVGHGHLHRARSVAAALDLPVTGLSSLPRPEGWPGGWVRLPADDTDPDPVDVTAGGVLHWVPLHDHRVRERAAVLSSWVAEHRPHLVVVDVSVEVTLLVRLHGVPVVSVVLPGDRSDPPHRSAHAASAALVAAWPPSATGMVTGLTAHDHRRLVQVGGLSRLPVTTTDGPRRPGPRRVVVLGGSGGSLGVPAGWDERAAGTPGWHWTVLGGDHGTWVPDPSALLREADVVVTHAGQNALAEVAALRRPAVVVPGDRPHDEQRTTAAALAAGPWPVLVEDAFPRDGWAERLDRVAAYDGARWAAWTDGHAAGRFARVVHDTLWRLALSGRAS